MTQDAFKQMQADEHLTSDIAKAQTPDEIRALLEAAMSRSGIADRDLQTGRFVRRDPLTPANQDAADETVTKTVEINGKEFTFEGTALEVERSVGAALQVANALKPAVTPRAQLAADAEQRVITQVEADLQLRRGEISTAEYLEKTNAIETYLVEHKGFDVDRAAAAQQSGDWQAAVDFFLNETEEGRVWKGGQRNLKQAQTILTARGWTEGLDGDKVAALRAVAKEMRENGLEFDGDYSPEDIIKLTDNASPLEIMEAWKAAHGGDPEAANQEFIRIQNGGSSGVFDR
jgi:hypothetical protein